MYKRMPGLAYLLVVLILCGSTLSGCIAGGKTLDKETAAKPGSKSLEGLKAEMIQKDSIMKTIKDLSSEQYRGRLAGGEAIYMTAQYISNYFARLGFENPKGLVEKIQAYIQPVVQLADKPTLQIIDRKGKVSADFKYTENFVLRRLSSETNDIDIKAEMYLVEDPEILAKNDDSLKGKILLIPWRYYDLLGDDRNPVDFAEKCGAAGVIAEFDLNNNPVGYRHLTVTALAGPWLKSGSYKPFVFADTDSFAKLAEASMKGGKLRLGCSSEVNINCITFNVARMIPGSDPTLKNECIIIGAHFDHVGDNMDGTYNPGALDNASGVSSMLELARVIKESKIQPKRSIVFIAFNGEESGSYGSRYYVEHPVYPLGKSVMINLDMIGAAGMEPLTIASGPAGKDSGLGEAFSGYASKAGIKYIEKTRAVDDNASFDRLGIPSICLSNFDFKSGYHSPHDTLEAVDGDKVVKITGLVLDYIRENAY